MFLQEDLGIDCIPLVEGVLLDCLLELLFDNIGTVSESVKQLVKHLSWFS